MNVVTMLQRKYKAKSLEAHALRITQSFLLVLFVAVIALHTQHHMSRIFLGRSIYTILTYHHHNEAKYKINPVGHLNTVVINEQSNK